MLGSLRPILEKLGKFETKLEMFAHPSDYDRFPVSLSVIKKKLFLDELAQNRPPFPRSLCSVCVCVRAHVRLCMRVDQTSVSRHEREKCVCGGGGAAAQYKYCKLSPCTCITCIPHVFIHLHDIL